MPSYSLENIKQNISDQRQMFIEGFGAANSPGSNIFMMSFMLAGIIDRTLSNIHGFCTLAEQKNFLCSASILRQQIDTAMRANAFNLVNDPENLADGIFQGKRFSDFLDLNGKKMKDYYLREKLNEEYGWISEVYENTNEAVHLSQRHVFATVAEVSEDRERTVYLKVTGLAEKPDEDYKEIYAAFSAALDVTYSVCFRRLSPKAR